MREAFIDKTFTGQRLALVQTCDKIITAYQHQGLRLTLHGLMKCQRCSSIAGYERHISLTGKVLAGDEATEQPSTMSALRNLLTGMVMLVVAVLVGIAVLPTLNQQIEQAAANSTEISPTSLSPLHLVPTVFIAGFVLAGIAITVAGARGALGDGEDSEGEEQEDGGDDEPA